MMARRAHWFDNKTLHESQRASGFRPRQINAVAASRAHSNMIKVAAARHHEPRNSLESVVYIFYVFPLIGEKGFAKGLNWQRARTSSFIVCAPSKRSEIADFIKKSKMQGFIRALESTQHNEE